MSFSDLPSTTRTHLVLLAMDAALLLLGAFITARKPFSKQTTPILLLLAGVSGVCAALILWA